MALEHPTHLGKLQGISEQTLEGTVRNSLWKVQWLSIYSDTQSSNHLTERGNKRLVANHPSNDREKEKCKLGRSVSTTWLQINLKNWSWGREVKSSTTDISDVQSWFSDVKDYPWKGEGIPMKRVGGEGEVYLSYPSNQLTMHSQGGEWALVLCAIYYNL